MFADEHDAAGEAIEPVARQRVPSVATLCPHDLGHAVVVVPPSGMHGNARRFVDGDDVLVLVDDCDGSGSDGRLMAVQRMRDDIAVADFLVDAGRLLAVDDELAGFNGGAVVGRRPVAEFVGEDFENLAIAPAGFAVCVVSVVVGGDAAQVAFEVVRSRPGVGGGYDDFRRRIESVWFELFGGEEGLRFVHGESHCWCGYTSSADEIRKDSGRGRQMGGL